MANKHIKLPSASFILREDPYWIQFSSTRLPKIKMIDNIPGFGRCSKEDTLIHPSGSLDIRSLFRRATLIQT